MTRSLLVLLAGILGCGGPSTSAPAAPVSAPLDVPPLDASAPVTATAKPPKLDATCTTDEDCEAVFLGDDCCGTCAPRIANKGWKRDIDAYCEREEHHGKCVPMPCSWSYSTPRCEKGLCK